jgi:hypothetical protein
MAIPSKVVNDLLIAPIEFCSIKSKIKIYGITDIIQLNAKSTAFPDFKYHDFSVSDHSDVSTINIIVQEIKDALDYGKVCICWYAYKQ